MYNNNQHTSLAISITNSQDPEDMLTDYPFVFDGYAAWVCRHCQHIPPHYRGGNYFWLASQPPPNHFVDMHLRFCPGLNPGNILATQQKQQSNTSISDQQAISSGLRDIAQAIQHTQQSSFAMQPPQLTRQEKVHSYIVNEPTNKRQEDPPGVYHPQSNSSRRRVSTTSEGASSRVHLVQQGFGDGTQPHQPHHQYPFPAHPSNNTLTTRPTQNQQFPEILSPGQSSVLTSPISRPTDDATYRAAIDLLTKKSNENVRPLTQGSDIGKALIDKSDAGPLTDYFYHMMHQLVVCRFSDEDRMTRGGKRENINIGYGGLQCIHCIEAPQARKFFWSNVNRLANSFAEIPNHVLKCKHCPENVKDALLVLKSRHADQMQMLPRGSQKDFFRRMWRRLHDGDTEPSPMTSESHHRQFKGRYASILSIRSGGKRLSSSSGNDGLYSPIIPANIPIKTSMFSEEKSSGLEEPQPKRQKLLESWNVHEEKVDNTKEDDATPTDDQADISPNLK